jgi:acyl dehydratase
MASHWCEMVEDANPIYHDEEYAKSTWLEGSFAPPTMLYTWSMRPVWPEERFVSLIAKLNMKACPNTIAVKAIHEYKMPLRYGDTLTITSQIAEIGEEKTTRLGTGHFLTTMDIFRNQHDEIVGTHSFVLFVYAPAGGNNA